MSDPAEALQGGVQQGSGAGGQPAPSGDDEVTRLKAENARLREERRTDRAKALGAEHGLTKTQVELLADVSAEKQEEFAKRLGEEMKGTQQPAAPKPGETPKPPANQPDLSVPDPEKAAAEKAAQAFSTDAGQTPVAKPTEESLQDQMNAEVLKAETFEEMQEVQERWKQKQREARRAAEEENLA